MTAPLPQALDEAARWVARMEGDGWSAEQEAELEAWLDADPRRRGALLQAQAAWMTLDPVGAARLVGAAPPPESLDEEEDEEPRHWFSRRGVLAGGGAAVAASIAGAFLLLNRGLSYATEVGEIRRVPLPDGSTAAINTSSKVEVKLAPTRRQVRIDEGEAWFQVAKDPERPFIVEAGRVRVQAVGTAFSVRRWDNGAEVLVTEGVVDAWTDGAEGNKVRLTAGSRAFVADNAAVKHEEAAPSSIDRTLAWRDGKIDLVGEPLGEAVSEFNRYNRRRLVLADPGLGSEQLDGVFRTDDPIGFANAIASTLGVAVDLSNPDEIRIGGSRN